MRTGETLGNEVHQLAQADDHDWMERNNLVPFPLVILVPGDRGRLVQSPAKRGRASSAGRIRDGNGRTTS